MRTSLRSLALLLAGAAALALPGRAAAAFKVVATVPGLAALAREVGGDKVDVESLSRGTQDPHFVDANPMLAVKLRNAGLLVDVGLELEIGWLPPLVNQSRNADIQPGGSRRLTAASAIQVMDLPTGPVSRAQGDLHPGGNPHFLTDPRRAGQVAAAIAAKLAELDRGNAAYYAQRLQDFQRRLAADDARWQAKLAPVKGRKVFTRHRTLTYFFDWSGVASAGELEPRPGVPPPPAHLADLVVVAQREGVKAILVEDYYDTKMAEVVARHSAARIVQIPGDVAGEPGLDTYEKYVDVIVNRVVGAIQ
ncbi:MAG TPA: metal ABC transporter substrate-binding protein [Anaeromyxobacter sp.]